jgi:hypothetical protein
VKAMKIKDLKPGSHIELHAKVINLGPLRKLWKCYQCNTKGIWLTPTDFKTYCPNCQAQPSKERKKGVWIQTTRALLIEDDTGQTYLDIWDKHIDLFKVGDNIHLINGFAKKVEDTGKVHVSKGTFGTIRLVNNG